MQASFIKVLGAICEYMYMAREEPAAVEIPGHSGGTEEALLEGLRDLRKGCCPTRIVGAVEDDLLLLEQSIEDMDSERFGVTEMALRHDLLDSRNTLQGLRTNASCPLPPPRAFPSRASDYPAGSWLRVKYVDADPSCAEDSTISMLPKQVSSRWLRSFQSPRLMELHRRS